MYKSWHHAPAKGNIFSGKMQPLSNGFKKVPFCRSFQAQSSGICFMRRAITEKKVEILDLFAWEHYISQDPITAAAYLTWGPTKEIIISLKSVAFPAGWENFRYSNPMIFLVLLHTLATCGDHDKSDENRMPKYLNSCTHSKFISPSCIGCNRKSCLFFQEVFITLHFVVLKVVLFESADKVYICLESTKIILR